MELNRRFLFIMAAFVFAFPAWAWGEGPPPALVVVGEATDGVVAPTAEFVGTVYYEEVSTVAAEVSGKVVEVRFDAGDNVRKGKMLVRIDSTLIERGIESSEAAYAGVLTDLDKAKKELARTEKLFKEEFVSEQVYDDVAFTVKGLETKARSMKADLGRLNEEMVKKKVRAPFDGVVLRREVDRGEWLSPGSPVAVVARAGAVEVRVDVPESVMRAVRKGRKVSVLTGGTTIKGVVKAVVPVGNVRTRTFPVKIKVKASAGKPSLVEGMEAIVTLPTGDKTDAVIVPRDAVISKFGMMVVFAVVDGTAMMMPVNVTGYSGSDAGLSPGIVKPGMRVVIKGNERLMDGAPVTVKGETPEGEPAKEEGK